MTRTALYKKQLKPAGDFICAISGLLCLFPLLFTIALILLVSTKKAPVFIQTRMGKKGKSFRIIKFRTMNDEKDLTGNLLPDEQRLTKFGSFLRKTSLDEFPQLLNVIMGDMSLIGPRPWIPEQLATFSEKKQIRRGQTKPGITGLAQVCGRNDITFRQRIAYDIHYVRHVSLRMDVIILLRTLKIVLKRTGIQQCNDAISAHTSSSSPQFHPSSEKTEDTGY